MRYFVRYIFGPSFDVVQEKLKELGKKLFLTKFCWCTFYEKWHVHGGIWLCILYAKRQGIMDFLFISFHPLYV